MSHVYLENTGSLELHQVQIVGGGRALGILSELICGEKKVLAVSDFAEELQVSALDPSGEMVQARFVPVRLASRKRDSYKHHHQERGAENQSGSFSH